MYERKPSTFWSIETGRMICTAIIVGSLAWMGYNFIRILGG